MTTPKNRVNPKSQMALAAQNLAPLALVSHEDFLAHYGWTRSKTYSDWRREPFRAMEWSVGRAVEIQLSNLVLKELLPYGWKMTCGSGDGEASDPSWRSLIRELRDPVTKKYTRRWTTAYRIHVERLASSESYAATRQGATT